MDVPVTTASTLGQLFSLFGLQENPFNVSPDLRFLVATPAHEDALFRLLFRIHERQGLMLLTGESGVGKTMLLHRLLSKLSYCGLSSSYVFHPRLDAVDLFLFILRGFGVPCESRHKGEVLQALHHWFVQRHEAGDTPVAIIDEAQALPADTLDELRMLLNAESSAGKMIEIVLAGQPELEEKLCQPELYPLRQRVTLRCCLPRLTLEQTSTYIQSRLAIAGLVEHDLFPPETLAAIYNQSNGIPRTINLFGAQAIIEACAERKRSVSPEDILQIASAFNLGGNSPHLVRGDSFSADQRPPHFPALAPKQGSFSALRQYWRNVANSFRRDARIFFYQCATFRRRPHMRSIIASGRRSFVAEKRSKTQRPARLKA